MKVVFLIIDPQVDFCSPKGSLYVPGADKDMTLLAKTIDRLKNKIQEIHTTLDSHHLMDIAHPLFWVDSKGVHPSPYTVITDKDVMNGKFRTTNPGMMARAVKYIMTLAANKRYELRIWPPHCLIGSEGATVVPELFKSFISWENDRFKMVNYVTKGSNFWTEHYSAVQADVPDSEDPGTQLNTVLIETLESADIIALSGEALDFCVANTVRDIANNFGVESIKKLVLLEDTTSAVKAPGGEHLAEEFLKEMTKRGMKTCKAKDFLI